MRSDMKVSVDRGLCEGSGMCVSVDPDLFELSDDDVLTILDDEPSEEKRLSVNQAALRCPRQALRVQG